MDEAISFIQSATNLSGVMKVILLLAKDKDMENNRLPKVLITRVSLKMISNMEREFNLLWKNVSIPNQEWILLLKKVVTSVTLSLDTNKAKEQSLLSMDNMRDNGMKVLNAVREQENTKRETLTKVNGSMIFTMARVHTLSLLWLMENKNLINTLDNLKKVITTEKVLWNMQMVTNMMVNGLLVKNKGKDFMSGLMVIIMMAAGKKIQLKAQELLAMEVFSTMVNSI